MNQPPTRRVPGSELDFVVVGTGRCGTGYVSGLLTTAGVKTGHEAVFGPDLPKSPPVGMRGDASWLAVPFLKLIPDIRVIHLVRDPLKTVRSLVGIQFFTNATAHGDYRAFALAHLRTVSGQDDLADSVKWTLEWNRRCQSLSDTHPYLRVRVEDLHQPDEVQKLTMAAIGEALDPVALGRAIDSVPTNANTRTSADLSWSDLPKEETTTALQDMAGRYGY